MVQFDLPIKTTMHFLHLQVVGGIIVFSWFVSLSFCAISIAYTKNYFFNKAGSKVIYTYFPNNPQTKTQQF